MTEHQQQSPNENAEKDPAEWVTGDEPMTAAQLSAHTGSGGGP
jgi:hypothetical protein